MIGHEGDALYIRDWYAEEQEKLWTEQTEDAPVGWKRLGDGCFRTAFLSPDGVAYKVQQHYGTYGQTNRAEWEAYKRFRIECRMPKGTRLPRWNFFELGGRGVIASERFTKLLNDYSAYDGEGSSYWSLKNRIAELLNIWDSHGANFAVDQETKQVVPIDLGAD